MGTTLKLGGLTFLAATLMMAMVAAAPPAAPAEGRSGTSLTFIFDTCDGGLLGDVTADGAVTLGDAQQILRGALGLSVNSSVEGRLLTHGDVDDNGSVTLSDAQQVLRYVILGASSVSYPIGQNICGSGDVVVRNQTQGTLPPNPYTLSLDGGTAINLPPGSPTDPGYATFSGVSQGEHTVTIGNLQGCAPTGGAPVSQTFTLGTSGILVNFAITCP